MNIKISLCPSGFYAVLVWDEIKKDWSLYWSGSRSESVAREVAADLVKKGRCGK